MGLEEGSPRDLIEVFKKIQGLDGTGPEDFFHENSDCIIIGSGGNLIE